MTSIREFLSVFFSQRAASRLAAGVLAGLALAGPAAQRAGAEVDSEHMFGFTEGSDIGAVRQLEAEVEEVAAHHADVGLPVAGEVEEHLAGFRVLLIAVDVEACLKLEPVTQDINLR